MGLYLKPSYGFIIKRKFSKEELKFVEKYDNDYGGTTPILAYDYDNNQIVFKVRKSRDIFHVFESSVFKYDDEFVIDDKTKEYARQEFKKLLEMKKLPETLKDPSLWTETQLLDVIS